MLLLAANFGAYVKALWFCSFYFVPFYSVLQMSILNLIWYFGVFEIYNILPLLKTKGDCGTSFNFRLIITSWACLLGLRLKLIFHWNVQLPTIYKSLFNLFAEVFMSCATVKRDALSATKIILDDKSSEK